MATREFVAGVNFDMVPKIVLLKTVRSLPAVKTLCILVTGKDVVTEENPPRPSRFFSPSSSGRKLSRILMEEATASAPKSASRRSASPGQPVLRGPAYRVPRASLARD